MESIKDNSGGEGIKRRNEAQKFICLTMPHKKKSSHVKRLRPHEPILIVLKNPSYSPKMKKKMLKYCSYCSFYESVRGLQRIKRQCSPFRGPEEKTRSLKTHLEKFSRPQPVHSRRKKLLGNQTGGSFWSDILNFLS